MNESASDKLPSGPSSVLSHMRVLRAALIRCVVVLGVGFAISMMFHGELIILLMYPLRHLESPVGLGFIDLTEPFMMSLRVAFLCSFVLSSPYWLYEIWRFAAPGLYLHERRQMLMLFGASWVLFSLGVCVCFFVILPMAVEFLVNYGADYAAPTLTLKNYISFLSTLVIGFGFVFEIPLVIFVLAMMELVSVADLRAARRYVVLGCFVTAAFLTPPDWISQLGMAVPIYLLYESAIVVVSRMESRRMRSKGFQET